VAADVRVGIVSWNTAALLDRCLRALGPALSPLESEIVVVDNASRDGSADVAAQHPGVEVVRNATNVGYARAMNQALAGSSAEVLLALNPDTEPAAGTLATLVAELRARPDVDLAVPRLVNVDGTLQHSVYRDPSIPVALAVGFVPMRWQRGWVGRRWWLVGSSPHDTAGPVDWAIGAVHAIRRSAVDGELPYSERWFMYVEDLELCWRLRRRGSQVWLCPGVEVVHVGNAAGEQAWGATRSARFWRATYDFVALARGRRYAQALGAVNVLVVARHLVAHRLGAALARDGAEKQRRLDECAQLRAVVRTHARVALRGAPPPDSPPATAAGSAMGDTA
jgi:GT2 family glycosyltransferase